MPIHLAMPMPVCDGSWNLRLVLYQEINEGGHSPPMVKGKMLISQIRIKKIRKDFQAKFSLGMHVKRQSTTFAPKILGSIIKLILNPNNCITIEA